MIIIALGSNVDSPWGSPAETLDRAVDEIAAHGIIVSGRSRWIETQPYGMTDQPGFVNGAIHVQTELSPQDLLATLQLIERAAGRKRREKWGPRTLDLDIIAYNDVVLNGEDNTSDLTVPHADLHNRSFVLLPVYQLNPAWQHPVSGKTVTVMLEELGVDFADNLPEISEND